MSTFAFKDVEGRSLQTGDSVYYARKTDYTANGTLMKTGKGVHMGKYLATSPSTQILKIQSKV